MSLGGQRLKQHVIEFVPGIGMITDGVVDATSTSGPWNWTPPLGVTFGEIDGCGGGGGGGGGGTSGVARGGGGSGAGAMALLAYKAQWVPNATLTVTLGAAGSAGSAGSAGGAGGTTTVSGLIARAQMGLSFSASAVAGTLYIPGSTGGAAGGTAGGNGGAGGGGLFYIGAGNGNGGSSGASPGAGTGGTLTNAPAAQYGCLVFCAGGNGGGGGSTTATTAGGNGYAWTNGGGNVFTPGWGFGALSGTGSQDGTSSYGGGGLAHGHPFGVPGAAGNGNVAASASTGFGVGGSGGGGNKAGTAGMPGYLRISYFAMD